jgi:Ca2+-binding RTX toxin-like protein
MATFFHIKANDGSSQDVIGSTAFDQVGPGTLIVDAGGYLISESGGGGAVLEGSWTVVINGAVGAFGAAKTGFEYDLGANSDVLKLTVGSTGDIFGVTKGVDFFASGAGATISNKGAIFGGNIGILATAPGANTPLSIINSGLIHGGGAGIELDFGTLTLVNSSTISGSTFSIHGIDTGLLIPATTHITNYGALQGDVLLADGGDDSFTNFKNVRHVIKSGSVNGVIDLGDGKDHFNGGANREEVRDGGGSDTYNFGGGNDSYHAVKNGGGLDGADTVNGGSGNDGYDAGGANSFVWINLDTKAHDLTPIAPGEGFVAARAAIGADVGGDQITGFENASGGNAGDILYGSAAANILAGFFGGDNLLGFGGNDTLYGGAGADGLAGGSGKDILFGNEDGDYFQFFSIKDSGMTAATRDVIMDFEQGSDFIDVSILDALRGVGGTFIGVQNFHKLAGEYRQSDSGTNTIVSGDINGDGKADFSIELKGHFVLQSGDFVFF